MNMDEMHDSIPVGLLSLDGQGVIRSMNAAFARMAGFAGRRALDADFADLLDACSRKVFQETLGRAFSGAPETVDVKMLSKGGKAFWAELRFGTCAEEVCPVSVADIGARKQAEIELRREVEQLALAVAGTPLGLWDWHVQTGELGINEQWAALIGYTLDELAPVSIDTWLRFCHPDDLENSNRMLEEHFAGKTEFYECEVRMRHKQGHWVWILDRGKLFERDAEGRPARTTGTHQDITSRKLTEEKLRESEERFRRIYENMSIGVAEVSLDFRIRAANDAYCSMLGYTEAELIGKHLKDITHPEVVEENLRLQQRLAGGGIDHFRMKKSFVHKSGETVYGVLDANLVRDVRGRPLYFLGSVVDTTEARRVEQAFLETIEDFEVIFENSQVGIMLLRGGRVFARGNQRLADILGYESPQEMAGISMRQLHLSEETFLHFGENYYSHLAYGEKTQIEYQMRKKDGSPVWCTLSGKAVDQDNLDRGVIWVIDDLEPRKALERELVNAKEEAEAASRAKSVFLANMSHELRTPLNGIMVMQQLLNRSNLNQEQQRYVEAATQSASRLTRLLSDILDLSRVEAGKMDFVSEPFDLRAVLNAVSNHFRPALKEKDVSLDVFIHPDVPPRLGGDQDRLLQVFYNLVGNALKFTKAGTISIEAYPLPARNPERRRVLFAVEDTGIGMPEEWVDEVFEPFAQAESSYRRQYQGAGLGLSICKRLVELMGGSIAAASREGAGAAFHFCMHFDQEPEAAPRPEREMIEKAHTLPKGLNLLLAEDEKVNRLGIKLLLELEGCRVTAVEDGRQALEALRRDDFDAVLMDVQMPVMDGLEATRAIREGRAGAGKASVPVIALTAYAMAGDKGKFLDAGMDGYIPKSVDEDVFWKALADALGRPDTDTASRDS